jgi:hypothetical protein
MPERFHRRVLRARGWLIPATLLALAPKCVLCFLAYTGLGIALGRGGREFCSAIDETQGNQPWELPAIAATAILAAVWLIRRSHHNGSSHH